ncbi:hypothetical protein AMJ96_CH00609 [Rhizobium sp. N113]|uniref:hypothetical protein n=1 Tax=Rhizobium TaxID=379 RepID=UPI0007EA7B68|nr:MULTISPECIES: hypothetical protein [Rhizobium]ANL02200.1 hypothetical protein AMJ99_CH00605 [Rhizobium esperanzae]ANL08328.1 hypothetical protein AMJ98_CH00605 [Rhizobium sp. N1341]ANL20377.1 hypothetical protein AMJ96_CH00609 [Rhizobium sp. N113]ANM33051.1 hypothetical protein AMK04_CH00605 [Rhizobium sp. N871]ANM39169.1 hypothetical protein AMK03_CH00605 [Rhizobium sp. N741]
MSDVKKIITDALSITRSAGKQLNDGISGIRGHIKALRRQRSEIAALPVLADTALQRVDEYISLLTADARSIVPDPDRFARPEYSLPVFNIALLLAAHVGPQIAESMKVQVEELYRHRPGISDAEREMRLQEIDRKILDSELAEESMIRTAEGSGFPVLRRRDADPRAVLAHDKVLP